MARWLYFVDIEGIGDPTASTHPDGRYAFSWSKNFLDDAASQDTDSLFVSGMKLLKWPSELEFAFDPFRGADAWGSTTLEFARDATALTHLWNGAPGVAAKLDTAINASTTTVVLDTGGLNDTTIHLEREAIYLGSVTGSGPYTYTGCTRGALGTTAAPHSVGDGADVECFARMHPATLAGRVVRLRRIPLGGTYSDIETRFPGVLRTVTASGGGARIAVEVEHVVSVMRQKKLYTNPWMERSGGTRGAGTPDAGYTGSRRAIFGNDDGAWIAPYSVLDNGDIEFRPSEIEDPFSGGPPLPEDGLDGPAREIYSSHDTAPSNSASPSTSTLPLSQDPGILCLQLLLTTEGGENHASYDLGLANLAGGIPASLVDVTGFEAWGESVGDVMTTFHIGHDSAEPVELYATIQDRILRPLGASLVQGQDGLLSVATFADALVYGSSNTIGASAKSIHNPTDLVQDRKTEDGIGRVVFTFNDRPGTGPDTIDSHNVLKRRRTFLGEAERLEIDGRGIGEEEEAMGLVLSAINRFDAPIIEYSFSVLNGADYWPGDVVSVTGSGLLASGSRGLTDAVCLVVGRREQLDDQAHLYHLRVRYVGEIYGEVGFIAPSAEVVSWDGGTSILTVAANTYTASTGPALTYDLEGFAASDVVQLVDEFGTVRDASITVVSIPTSTTIELSGVGVTPAAGDVLRVATYASAVSSQQEDWAFVGDDDNGLGASDTGKDYLTR